MVSTKIHHKNNQLISHFILKFHLKKKINLRLEQTFRNNKFDWHLELDDCFWSGTNSVMYVYLCILVAHFLIEEKNYTKSMSV